MKHVLVKICGITRVEDALKAAESGAHYLGFIFYRGSKRYVSPDVVSDIVQEIKDMYPSVLSVGVFVNETRDKILNIKNTTGIDLIQLHGDESIEFADSFDCHVIKAVRIRSIADIEQAIHYNTKYILFDAYKKGLYGGTGAAFNWDLLDKFNERDRLFLSGGLNKENIIEAIKRIQPFAVDVSSGVESEPGIKDKKKIEELFAVLKSVPFD